MSTNFCHVNWPLTLLDGMINGKNNKNILLFFIKNKI